jgi:hypothetical protein
MMTNANTIGPVFFAQRRYRPILLKKSTSVSTAEKFALGIEICVVGKSTVFNRTGQNRMLNQVGFATTRASPASIQSSSF